MARQAYLFRKAVWLELRILFDLCLHHLPPGAHISGGEFPNTKFTEYPGKQLDNFHSISHHGSLH